MEEKELLKIMKEEDAKFDAKFSSLSETDRDEIKGNAKINYFEEFQDGKSNERYFYQQICLKNARIDWYTKTTMEQKDVDGSPILDEKGKPTRKPKVPTVRMNENGDNNDKGEDDESNPNEDVKTDTVNIGNIASGDTVGIDEPDKKDTFLNYLEQKFNSHSQYLNDSVNRFYASAKSQDLTTEEEKMRGKEVKNRIKILFEQITEIKKHLLIKGRIKILHEYEQIKQSYTPLSSSIPYPNKPELDNLSNEAKGTVDRLQYLKNAENRKWMEMAIAEMRKSKEKLDEYVSGWDEEKQKKFRKDTPILSSIVLDKNGKFVASYFKGKIGTPHPHIKGKDITFDIHCEYCLFTKAIKEKDLHLVKEGTLYVTLEPCNKRGFWLDGDEEKPKIPCAVRCLEAGLKKVFIGTKDDNKVVMNKGRAILESGKYIFKIKNGKITGETDKELKAEGLLEEYFKEKNYPSEDIEDKRVYTIGKSVEVHDFDPDLIEEVRLLNSEFLRQHSRNQFRL